MSAGLRKNVSDATYRSWDDANAALRAAQRGGSRADVDRAQAEVRRVYEQMKRERSMRPNASAPSLSDLPDDAVRITDSIYAFISPRTMDWHVYEQLDNGRWALLDVKRTLRQVRQQYDPDTFPMEENGPADTVDESGETTERPSESDWKTICRMEQPQDALNFVNEYQARSLAPSLGRIEEVPSRSRSGRTSYVGQIRWIDGKKQPLDIVEKRYCDDAPSRRRTSRNPSRRPRRTSRKSRPSRR